MYQQALWSIPSICKEHPLKNPTVFKGLPLVDAWDKRAKHSTILFTELFIKWVLSGLGVRMFKSQLTYSGLYQNL